MELFFLSLFFLSEIGRVTLLAYALILACYCIGIILNENNF